MADSFFAEIRIFPYTFAPRSWADCDGQLIAISQNLALFSLIGTIYGGDGRNTFGLPNLLGRLPVGARNGPGLSPVVLGEQLGADEETLTVSQIPSHSHSLNARGDGGGAQASPANARLNSGKTSFGNGGTPVLLAADLGQAGGGQAHSNAQPTQNLRYCICTQGIFPSRS